MKTRNLHFSAKLRQYRHVAKQIDRGIRDGSFRLLSKDRQRILLRKLKERLRRLAPIVSHGKMKNALAGISMLMATGLGAQSFAPPVQSPFGLPTPVNLAWQTFADLDNDGDMDLFSIEYQDYVGNQMRFYENSGTPEAPVFSADDFIDNPFGLSPGAFHSTPVFADVDNDGDLDLMTGDFYDNNFFFFENTGTPEEPAFGDMQVNPFGISGIPIGYYTFPSFVDLDDDGDLDLYASAYYGDNYYYENIGTPEAPSFAAPVASPFGINTPVGSAYFVFPVFGDVDNDGDFDLLSSQFFYGVNFQYYENVGTPDAPDFAAPVSSPFGLDDSNMLIGVPTLVDIDNDGDLDLLATDIEYATATSVVTYFENTEIVNEVPPTSNDFEVFINEDESYVFSGLDFPFLDGNIADELQAVQITAPPVVGSLTLSGTAVNTDQIIDVADLANLEYTPNPNDFGNNYSEFSFKVSDGGQFSVESNLVTINVNPVNDVPASANAMVDMYSDFDNPFSTTDFPFTDADGEELAEIEIIETVDKGNLTLAGNDILNNQVLTADQVNQLIFTPVPGEDGMAYTSFKFRVSDGMEYEMSEYIMTINIVGPNALNGRELNADINISPNPVSDMLTLNVKTENSISQINYSIFNENGSRIYEGIFLKNGKEGNAQISVADFSAGVYFLKIYADGKMKTVRFLKQ